MLNHSEKLITYLDEKVDSKYLSEKNTNLWKAVPYETKNFKGVMLGCGWGSNAIPITIHLAVQDTYRIWLGMYYCRRTQLRARLSGDLCFQRIIAPHEPDPRRSRYTLYEIFWKEADLTGQDLILEGLYNRDFFPGALAYIRLELTDKIQTKLKKEVIHPLAITNEGARVFGDFPHRRPEDLLELFENIPEESCVRILLWGSGSGDICNYPTRVGTFQTGLDRENTDSKNYNLWRKKGWNSLKLIREYTRRRKWEFHVYIRMEAFCAQFPFGAFHSEFFYSHPEYHCFDRSGKRIARLSYAYPEVQEHMLDLVKEITAYDPDGICLAFNRGIPVVLYEQIMVEGFKREYSVDPRGIGERDPRWMDYQAQVITSFIKKVKAVLKPSQHLSVIIPGNEPDSKRWGLDVACWIKEGIVDTVFPIGQGYDEHDVHRDDPDGLDFKFFAQLDGREKIRLIPMLYPGEKFNEDYQGWRQLIYSFFDQGADGYAVWDAQHTKRNGAPIFPDVGYLGYEKKERDSFVIPKVKFKRIKLLSISGFRFDRYHYFEVV